MLMAMAVYDTAENRRSWMTKKTLMSLAKTVNFSHHRLIISDNGSCKKTHDVYGQLVEEFGPSLPFVTIFNGKNLGTANAINKVWKLRRPGEHVLKMDNDCVIHQPGWADWMEDVFERDPTIGICGLKRKDLEEWPGSPIDWYKSTIRMLSHERGQRWLVVEEVMHVMGTCQSYNSALLDKIGYLYQPGVYAFDDSLAAVRAKVAGFKSVFLHGFEIDHIDPGGDDYTEEKRAIAGKYMQAFLQLKHEYMEEGKPVYYDGGPNL